MNYSREIVRENKVKAYNRLCKQITKVAKEIEPIVESFVGTSIYKQDGNCTKKFRDAIQKIINPLYYRKPMLSVIIREYSYSIYLEFKTDFRVDQYGCNYINKSLCIGKIDNGVLESQSILINAEMDTQSTTVKRVETTEKQVEKLRKEFNTKMVLLRKKLPSEFTGKFPTTLY
jgi:hypothetical protein